MSTHTPGPWEARKGFYRKGFGRAKEESIVVAFVEGYLRRIATCRDPEYWIEPEMDEANARLVSAAPELLSALELLLENADEGLKVRPGDAAWETARAAIAKARGTK